MTKNVLTTDNAPIHTGHVMEPTLRALLAENGIELKFLPKYRSD
jgi:hypothetical protein